MMRHLLLAGALLAGACTPSAPPEPAPYAVGEEPKPYPPATINMIDRYGQPVTIRLLDLAKAQEQGMRIESGKSLYCRQLAKAGRTDAKQCPGPPDDGLGFRPTPDDDDGLGFRPRK